MWTLIDEQEKPATPLPEIDEAIRLQEHKPTGPRLGIRVLYLIAMISLCLLLLLQAFIHFPQTVMTVPALHQTAVKACELLGCGVPLRQQPRDWVINTSSLTPHPDFQDAWRLQAELQLQGERAVSLPALQVKFYDRDGSTAAERPFTPDQYLARANNTARVQSALQERQPGTLVSVTLDIIDPGTGLPNFDINLLPIPDGGQP